MLSVSSVIKPCLYKSTKHHVQSNTVIPNIRQRQTRAGKFQALFPGKQSGVNTEQRRVHRVLRTEAAVTSRVKGEPALPAAIIALHLLKPS